jgi:hypothetical protein
MGKNTPAFNPLLLTNRATAYIKLNQRDAALKDANEYISRSQFAGRGTLERLWHLRRKSVLKLLQH